MISDNLTFFAGQPVFVWDRDIGFHDPANYAHRITLSWDDDEDGAQWTDLFAAFLAEAGVEELQALIVGAWGFSSSSERNVDTVIEALVAARERLPNLRALFLGDITSEEDEISWIAQGDVSPLFAAYPKLEELVIRGGQGLRLGRPSHAALKSLTIQTGGLEPEVVAQVFAADLPALEHLELWLGDPNYGGDCTVEDLRPVLSGELFPNLKYLGLCDSPEQDEIAKAAATAPILERLEVLDLSRGTLGDEGAAALLASPAVRNLRKLDLHHHYLSQSMMEQLQGLGIEVNLDDAEGEADPDDRYIAVSE